MKYKIILLLLALYNLTFAQNALIHNFDFNNTLRDTKGTGVVLEVHPNSKNTAFGDREWSWTADTRPGGGLILHTSTLTTPQNYSVGFRIKYTDVTGRYKKLLSFKGKLVDNGLYFHNTKLVFYPFDPNDDITYHSDTFYDFVFSRSSNDSINVYRVDNAGVVTKIYSEYDTNDDSVPAQTDGKYEFGFFMDDETQHTEYANGGTVRGIRVWNYPLSEAEIGDALSSVSTGASSSPTLDGAVLTGTVDPKGTPTDVVYEYGLTTSYGSVSATIPPTVTGDGAQTVSTTLSGLTKGTEYHYRIRTTEQGTDGRTFYGSDRVFRTLGTFVLQYNVDKNGSLTGITRQPLTEGEDGTEVTAVPDLNYHFVRWSDGVLTASRTETAVKKDLTLVAEIVIDSYDLTYTSGSGGTLSGDATQRIVRNGDGSEVSAVANSNYHFVKWSDGETVNPRTDLNLLSDYAVEAEFAIDTYTLTYSSAGNGSITGTTPQTVDHGSDGAEVTATAAANYHFDQWSDGNTNAQRQEVNVTRDTTVTAQFIIDTYVITYSAGPNGSVSGTAIQTIDYGAKSTAVTAIPIAGFKFDQWSDGSKLNPRVDTITSTTSVTANFTAGDYKMLYTSNNGGTLSGDSIQDVTHGVQSTDVTAIPKTGYHFSRWSDGKNDNPRSDLAIVSDINVRAEFLINTYKLTYAAGPNGSLTGTFIQVIEHGANGTSVAAVADLGYHFVKWDDGNTDNPRTDYNVIAIGSFIAEFTINTYTIEYVSGANGMVSGNTPQLIFHGEDGTDIIASPDLGYHFNQWDDGNTDNPRSDLDVTADATHSAQFVINAYNFTYTSGGNGSINGTTPQTISHGTDGTPVQANADPGYKFDQWSDGAVDNPRTEFNVTADGAVTALFILGDHSLDYAAGSNGSLTGDASQSGPFGFTGTEVIAVPDGGYHFVKWDDGVKTAARTDDGVTDIDVIAEFHNNVYALNYVAGADGSLSGISSQNINHGRDGTAVEALPNSNYHFVQWSDGSFDNPRTDKDVLAAATYTAQFEIDKKTLIYTIDPNGTLTGTTTQVINYNGTGTAVTANPNTNYHFVQWDDGNLNPTRTDNNVIANDTYNAIIDIDTYNLNYSAGANGSIVGITSQTIDHGADGSSVEAVPAINHRFVKWDDGSTENPRIDKILIGDLTFAAEFALGLNSLTYTSDFNGKLTGDSLQSVTHGMDGAVINAVPNAKYHFVRWTDGSIANPRTDLNITVDIRVEAEFAYNVYELTYTADVNGSLTGDLSQSIPHGSDGSAVTATGITGYHFDQWDDGNTDNPRTDIDVITGDNLIAQFVINSYVLNYIAGPNGSLSGTTTQQVDHGSDATSITATPDANHHFVKWSDDLTDNPRTDTNVTIAISATAEFAIDTNTLTYVAGANGSITGATPQTVDYGSDGSPVEAVPATDYRFVQWNDGSIENPRIDKGVTGDLSLTAEFLIGLNTLTYTSGHGGSLTGDSLQTVNHGDDGTEITATPATNYHFVRWTDGSIINPRTDLSIGVDISVEAEFAYDHYTANYIAGVNGTLQGNASQSIGAGFNSTAIEAVPAISFHFLQWSDGSAKNPRVDMNVTANLSVSAEFSIDDYSVTYATSDGGTVTGTLDQTIAHGLDATDVIAIPDLHWYFTGWSDGSFSNPRHDLAIKATINATAEFSIGQYTLDYSTAENGIIAGNNLQTVLRGESGTPVTAEPNYGYLFDQWSDGIMENPRTDPNIKSNHTLIAFFVKDTLSTPIYISEGVSPNGDGINDTWSILFIEDFPSNSVKILNRSGALVYKKTNYQNSDGFDGIANVNTVGSNQLPEGTYFYVIELGDGNESVSGYFTLLR